MTRQEIRGLYINKVATLSAEIGRLRRRSRAYVIGELLAFALVIAGVVGYVSTAWGGVMLIGSAVMLALYLLIRYLDVENSARIEQRECLRSVYDKERQYLDGDFSAFADGSRYLDPSHAYSLDMDIFGRDSLFQRINRTITTGGSDWLAGELTGVAGDSGASGLSASSALSAQAIADRQDALRELAEAEPLRSEFLAFGQRKTIDTAEILSALKGMKDSRRQQFPAPQGEGSGVGSVISVISASLATAGLLLVLVLAIADVVPSSLALLWFFIQFGIVFAANASAFRAANKAVNRMHKELRTYISLIVTIVGSGFTAKESRDIIAQLTGTDSTHADALASFSELRRILDGLDRQGNALYRFLSDALFCYDFWLVRRFRRWQQRYLPSVEDWIAAVSHFDALVSMATYRYNEPSATDAEIIADTEAVVYEAEALRHPFLGDTAVPNDFRLLDGHYYIVTGANMAGKSTFLRTVGINYILARCGLPVFAGRLRVSLFSLFSSMRTTDDLSRGISYFNAELLRLQQLIAHCRRQLRTLIILDEILKGTNSLDKLNGSRLFLESIARLPVTGIIATHDLELSKMADERPDRFHNYCFEIGLAEEITYTYRITPGVARNQNATFLLKGILKG